MLSACEWSCEEVFASATVAAESELSNKIAFELLAVLPSADLLASERICWPTS
jgi:hypothetical protein